MKVRKCIYTGCNFKQELKEESVENSGKRGKNLHKNPNGVFTVEQYNEACLHFATVHPNRVKKGNLILNPETVEQVLIKV